MLPSLLLLCCFHACRKNCGQTQGENKSNVLNADDVVVKVAGVDFHCHWTPCHIWSCAAHTHAHTCTGQQTGALIEWNVCPRIIIIIFCVCLVSLLLLFLLPKKSTLISKNFNLPAQQLPQLVISKYGRNSLYPEVKVSSLQALLVNFLIGECETRSNSANSRSVLSCGSSIGLIKHQLNKYLLRERERGRGSKREMERDSSSYNQS